MLEGAGRLVDFGDMLTEYNRSSTGEIADYLAFAADWEAIGGDLSDVLSDDDIVQQIQAE